MSAGFSPAALTAYRTFATWRRDILAAGFMAKGAPLAAYRALDAVHMGRSTDVKGALARAVAAYAEWCSEPGPTRDHCQPTLDALRAEIAALEPAGPDLTYSEDGLFVTFYAETPAGEEAWNTMAATNDGVARFLAPQLAGIVAQLRAAGYRVAKAKPHKPLAPDELDRLLEALEGDLSR